MKFSYAFTYFSAKRITNKIEFADPKCFCLFGVFLVNALASKMDLFSTNRRQVYLNWLILFAAAQQDKSNLIY